MKRRYSASKVEWDYIEQLVNAIEDVHTRELVSNALQWYVIKAGRYRMFEYILNAVTLIVPSALVVLNQCVEGGSVAVQLVAAVSGTLAASAKAFSKLHDKRVSYRTAAESIKSETALYIHRADIYKTEKRDALFIKRIIEIRRNENGKWAEIENDKSGEEK